MLKGTIFLTSEPEIVLQAPMDGSTKIIDMDEENSIPNSPHTLKGTCLLPPIEAKIAEVDGDEMKYNLIYSSYLLSEFPQNYITALIAFLYTGGNLLIYLPEDIGYSNTSAKFCEMMFGMYGIHIGVLGDPNPANSQSFYNYQFIPTWLNLLYKANIISPNTFLLELPLNAKLDVDPEVLSKLLNDLRPYEETIKDQITHLYDFHMKVHKNPKVYDPIIMVE